MVVNSACMMKWQVIVAAGIAALYKLNPFA